MPGKGRGRGITSCDYKGELRKPGERRINSNHHDSDEHVTSTSAAAQTERENSVSGVNDLSSLTNKEEKDTDVFNADEKKEFENDTSSSKDEPDLNTSKSNQDDTVATATNHTQEESNSGSLTPEPKTPISTLSISSVATSKLSPFAKEFVPKSHLPSAFKSKPSHLSTSSTGPDSVLIDCVKDTIYQLSLDPGELEAIVDGLVETMEGWISQDDHETLPEIANLIVTQAVTEPNFTYTGARLANYLDKNMNLGENTKKKFRDFFLHRCKEELLKKDELKSNPSSEPHVLGFAKFLAELFCNFRSWSNNEPFHIFHKALLQMLDTLIEHGSDEAFRCIGQIMKMTGYLIDDPVYKNLKDREHKVDTIFDCLNKAIKESKTCSESTKNFLKSLFELRANNWGQNESETRVEGTPETQHPEGTLDSAQAQQYAYYSSNTEGLESNTEGLATDALGFEPWSTGYYDADEYYQYPDDMQQYDAEQYISEEEGEYGGYEDLEDPEFDAELEADFEKFLSMQ